MSEIIRPDVSDAAVARAFMELRMALTDRVTRHGPGAFAGPHEIDGVLDEEIREWKHAVWINDNQGRRRELLDVAVVCLFGLASLEELGR